MASTATLGMLAAHPEWIPPRSDVRVFLGEPGGPEACKTTIEPGNSFSPGIGTFGVTWWLRLPTTNVFFAPEVAPLPDLHWHYADGYFPILACQTAFAALDITHRLLQDGTASDNTESVCGEIAITNTSSNPIDVQLFLVLRSLGPAGWPVPALQLGDANLALLSDRGQILLATDVVPTAAGCGVGDPSPLARAGMVPDQRECADADGWCYGVMRFDRQLAPSGVWTLHCECPLQTSGTLAHEMPSPVTPQPARFATRAAAVRERWRNLLGSTQLDVPDHDFVHAYYAGLQHMLTAMVGTQPHIAPLAYPLPWLRDGVMIIRCLELAGLHDVARAATEWCIGEDFFGGFGPEGDAPSQGIWAIVQHYRFTNDRAWLALAYPAIRRKVDWLMRMRRATAPLRAEMIATLLPFMQRERAGGIICLAARDGLIRGVMDHGVDHALGWVNQWALCGLREASFAARELDAISDATTWDAEAVALHTALVDYATSHPDFFAQERTVNSLLWPTDAWRGDEALARARFVAWWERERGSGEAYRPEPYWLYFEFAQAHNALLLDVPAIAAQVMSYRLAHQDLPGLYGWREGGEGVGMENALQGVTLLPHLRGCQRFDAVTPHGWSQAEFWLLQRAMLVEEWDDGLLLLAGVPDLWLTDGQHITLRDFPTAYGLLTLHATGETTQVAITIAGIITGTAMIVRLPGCAAATLVAAADAVTILVQKDTSS